jgi:hypothetical protein
VGVESFKWLRQSISDVVPETRKCIGNRIEFTVHEGCVKRAMSVERKRGGETANMMRVPMVPMG